jgi:hypothetical protein
VVALPTACYSNDGTSSLARERLVLDHMLSSVIKSGSRYIDHGTSLPECEYIVVHRALSMVATSRSRYGDEGMSSLVFSGSSAPGSMFSEVEHLQSYQKDDGKNTPTPACFVLDGNVSAITNFLNGNIDDGISSLVCERPILMDSPLPAVEHL